METDDLQLAANKLRLHIKANPVLGDKFAEAISEACKEVGLDMPREFFDKLIIVHESEMDTAFSVTVLPVGSQCGL